MKLKPEYDRIIKLIVNNYLDYIRLYLKQLVKNLSNKQKNLDK